MAGGMGLSVVGVGLSGLAALEPGGSLSIWMGSEAWKGGKVMEEADVGSAE